MQWDDSPAAGFSAGTPWLGVNPNHSWLNAAAQRGRPDSVYAHYRALIRLRHTDPVVVDGDFTMILPEHPSVYAFRRSLGDRHLVVWANLSDERVVESLPDGWDRGELVLTNLRGGPAGPGLAPWEARILRLG